MRSNDTPLKSVSEDDLDRRIFAQNFARGILEVDVREEGFVAALTGPWGSGKSTTINFIAHYLKQIHVNDALESRGINFSFEYLDSLHDQYQKLKFYDEESRPNRSIQLLSFEKNYVKETISKILKPEEDIDDIYEYSLEYHKMELENPFTVVHFSPWHFSSCTETTTAIIEELFSVIENSFGQEQYAFAEMYAGEIFRVTALAAATSLGVSGFEQVIKTFSKKAPISLLQSKENLSNSLKRQKNKKIFFIIDDLDRLSPEEASSILSSIKGITNLPNVIYLLSYDQREFSRIVAKSIGRSRHEYGASFLEKIVQFSKNLPMPTSSQIEKIFQRKIVTILSDQDIEIDNDRMAAAWEFSIRHYINTPRDANRLANNYSMSINSLKDRTDPTDLLLISTLEIFEPDVHQNLKNYIWP